MEIKLAGNDLKTHWHIVYRTKETVWNKQWRLSCSDIPFQQSPTFLLECTETDTEIQAPEAGSTFVKVLASLCQNFIASHS